MAEAHCSFCGQPRSQVGLLFKGLGPTMQYICDGCVSVFAALAAIDNETPDLTIPVAHAFNAEIAKRQDRAA